MAYYSNFAFEVWEDRDSSGLSFRLVYDCKEFFVLACIGDNNEAVIDFLRLIKDTKDVEKLPLENCEFIFSPKNGYPLKQAFSKFQEVCEGCLEHLKNKGFF